MRYYQLMTNPFRPPLDMGKEGTPVLAVAVVKGPLVLKPSELCSKTARKSSLLLGLDFGVMEPVTQICPGDTSPQQPLPCQTPSLPCSRAGQTSQAQLRQKLLLHFPALRHIREHLRRTPRRPKRRPTGWETHPKLIPRKSHSFGSLHF